MPENCAQLFMSSFYAGQEPDMTCIDQLCGLALSQEEPVAKQAVCALYGTIVEGLCDDFSGNGVAVCNRVLLRIAEFLYESGKTGACATDLGIGVSGWQQAFLKRHDQLIKAGRRPLRCPPERILVLSRVTIGADVMISSIVIRRLRQAFPEAEIVLVGPAHMEALLLFDNKVRNRLFPYERNCSLLERFAATCRLAELIQEECSEFAPSSVLLVDPDSRLSQLGLIPLLSVERTRYFCSRMEMEDNDNASLVEITNGWLDQWLGEGQRACYPAIRLNPEARELARDFMQSVGQNGKAVLLVNLGVGRNDNKRIPPPFEEELLLALLDNPELVVVLDSGYSPAGLARAKNLMQSAISRGHGVEFSAEEDLPLCKPAATSRLIGVRCSIGMIGALIAEADCFFGYDSCCQHLASAADVPGLIVFSGYRLERFQARWRPRNRQESISVLSCRHEGEMDLQQCHNLVEKVARRLRSCCLDNGEA